MRPTVPDHADAADALHGDLDRIFDDPALTRALVAVRVDALDDGRTLYVKNADTLVMPASNMKIVTMAVAAERLGWGYRYRTRLEAAGPVAGGTLRGDLVVVGSGDPSIGSPDSGDPRLFEDWAGALRRAGIERIDGRIIGDDRAFAHEGPGAGWSWDYLADGYAAPTSALSYNENVDVVHISPGTEAGAPAIASVTPPGHLLGVENHVVTAARGTSATISFSRQPGMTTLVLGGRIPIGSTPIVRTAAEPDPTRYFVQALRLALITRGISVRDGATGIVGVETPVNSGERRTIAEHESEPLSSLVGYAMKVSQNFYGETIFQTIGRSESDPGSAERGRAAVKDTLSAWGLPPDALVMEDGSGLSRYDYVTASLLVQILTHVWHDETLRGPFVAALPVGAHDGTLESRMRNSALDRRVQAKTGTITNVRALSGYMETDAGEKLVFSMIANNTTAPGAQIDAVMEKALLRLLTVPAPH